MNNFTFYSPTYFVFGRDTENDTGKYVRRFGGSRVLIHYGGGSAVRSGLLSRVRASLDAEGLFYTELGGVRPNPRSGLVYKGIEQCRAEKIDFILAVGGGSVIDSAKGIAAGVPYGGDFWDYYATDKVVETALPVGTILTIAAAGSEGSGNSVVTLEPDMLKRSSAGDALRPKFSVLNPALTCSLPPYQTAAGATDIIAHIFERYFTLTPEVEVTDRLCESVLLTMIHETPRVIADPDNYDARANIMWAGMIAHNNVCGVGRAQDWASHGIEHELSALYDVAHGAGLAVIFPAWMRYVYKQDISRFCQMATRVWGVPMDYADPEATALEGIKRLRSFLHDIGMPLTFSELGAKEQDIPLLVKTLGVSDSSPMGSFKKLGPKDVDAIYRLAL